jgi:hypothetical protein
MTSKKYIILPMFFLVVVILLTACSSNKEPASLAIKSAEDAFNAIKGEAVMYIPDQAKSVEGAINAAKASFEKGNFDEALNTAKAIPEKVQALNAAVAVRKAELKKSWEEISGGMPQMIEAIKSKLDILKASKRLPKSLDNAKLEQAEMHYIVAAMSWDEASKTYPGGNLADAVQKAKTAKDEAMEAMKILEIQAPEAAAK